LQHGQIEWLREDPDSGDVFGAWWQPVVSAAQERADQTLTVRPL